MLSQDTINLLSALVTVLVLAWNPIKQLAETLATRAQFLQHPDAQQDILVRAVDMAVKSVEQLSQVADEAKRIAPADRKDAAMKAATDILAHFHVKVSPDVLSTYIENAVALLPKSGYTGNAISPAVPDNSQPVPAMDTPPILAAV